MFGYEGFVCQINGHAIIHKEALNSNKDTMHQDYQGHQILSLSKKFVINLPKV
jgi:hypothetical protein